MIQLEIKTRHSSDVELDVWQPESNVVWFTLQLEIGAKADPRADVFETMVSTPEGLLKLATPEEGGLLSKRGLLVLREFSWTALWTVVDEILCECQGSSWDECVSRLQRFFFWEYEDYSEESAQN